MAKESFDACCIDLTKGGMPSAAAKRACGIAYYREFGELPGGKAKRTKSITGAATKVGMSLSAAAPVDESEGELVQIDVEVSYLEIAEGSTFSELLNEFKTEKSNSPRLFREMRMVTQGTFNNIPITEETIDAFCDNFSKPIPLQQDHDLSWAANHGFIHSVTKKLDPDENKMALYGLAEIIGTAGVERVLDGRAKGTSIGFMRPWVVDEEGFWKPGPTSGWYLREHSFTHFPACPPSGIVNQNQQQPEQKVESVNSQTQAERTPEQMATAAGTGAGGVTPPAADTTQTTQVSNAQKTEASQVTMSASEYEAFKARIATAEASANQMTQLQKDFADMKAATLAKQCEDLSVSFVAAGLTSGHAAVEELAFIKTLTPEQTTSYKAYKEKQGSLFRLGQISVPDIAPPSGGAQLSAEDIATQKAELKSLYAAGGGGIVSKIDNGQQQTAIKITPGAAG